MARVKCIITAARLGGFLAQADWQPSTVIRLSCEPGECSQGAM